MHANQLPSSVLGPRYRSALHNLCQYPHPLYSLHSTRSLFAARHNDGWIRLHISRKNSCIRTKRSNPLVSSFNLISRRSEEREIVWRSERDGSRGRGSERGKRMVSRLEGTRSHPIVRPLFFLHPFSVLRYYCLGPISLFF